VNGQATMRIDAFDVFFGEITDGTMSFTRLTLRAVGMSIDATGSMRDQLNIAANTETLTLDIVQLDNSTALTTKSENLVIVSVYNNIFAPTSYTDHISGKVFDQVHGYVDITTPALLVFSTLSQLFPNAGQMLLTGEPIGQGSRRILATALTARMVRLQLDLDGDSVYEIDARLLWLGLSDPIGSDLGDSDGDAMHNSWESAFGLNPNSDDAASDNDGDTFTNLSEYMAGTHPNNASSHP
jgi:hypothetical protein